MCLCGRSTALTLLMTPPSIMIAHGNLMWAHPAPPWCEAIVSGSARSTVCHLRGAACPLLCPFGARCTITVHSVSQHLLRDFLMPLHTALMGLLAAAGSSCTLLLPVLASTVTDKCKDCNDDNNGINRAHRK